MGQGRDGAYPRGAHALRGSSFVESTLVIGFTLMLLYAGIELGVAGYYQVSADGAAFISAHEHAENASNPEADAHTVFNHFFNDGSQMRYAQQPASTMPNGALFPVDYGAQNSTQRVGGAGVVGSVVGEASVQRSGFANIPQFGGAAKPIRVQGDVEEQVPWILGSHYDVGGFTSQQSAMAGIQYYFGSWDDVPPTLIGFKTGMGCYEWQYNPLDQGYDTCMNNGVHTISFGLSAYLDDISIDNTKPGVVPIPPSANSSADSGTFWEMLSHQQQYVKFANVINPMTWSPTSRTLATIPPMQATNSSFPMEGVYYYYKNGLTLAPNNTNAPGLCTIYSWDIDLTQITGVGGGVPAFGLNKLQPQNMATPVCP